MSWCWERHHPPTPPATLDETLGLQDPRCHPPWPRATPARAVRRGSASPSLSPPPSRTLPIRSSLPLLASPTAPHYLCYLPSQPHWAAAGPGQPDSSLLGNPASGTSEASPRIAGAPPILWLKDRGATFLVHTHFAYGSPTPTPTHPGLECGGSGGDCALRGG